MKVTNKLYNENGAVLVVDTNPDNKDSVQVVYAHVDTVNDNGLKLNSDSLEVTRSKYPVLVEHSDRRVEDVVGYIETTGKPNEKGEFVGDITFYNTPQGQHAKQLWADGVFTELSVSYYIKDYDVIDDDDSFYIDVKQAILKEVSIVSVGADRNTFEIKKDDADTTDDTNEPEDNKEPAENATDLERKKLELLKKLLD